MLIKNTNSIMYTNNTEFKNENVNSTTSALHLRVIPTLRID